MEQGEIMTDNKTLVKIIEKIGEGIEQLYFFCCDHQTEVTWFGLGMLFLLIIQAIF